MSVVLLLWRTRLRSSWRAVVVLVALIGIGGSAALAIGAGARRTASANDAVLRDANAAEIAAAYGPADPNQIDGTVRAVDGVADTTLWVGFQSATPRTSTGFTLIGFWQDPILVSRPVVISGRFPTGPHEAMLNERAARELGLGLGGHVELTLSDAQAGFDQPAVDTVEIVGVGLLTDEVIQDELALKEVMLVPRAFTERHVERAVWGKARIDLRPGADAEAVAAGLAGQGIFVDEQLDEDRARVQDALRPLIVTLASLAALCGTATTLVAGQALTRLLRRRRSDDRSLAAMGCATRQLVGADLLSAATVASAGTALAAVLAAAASPLFPVGPVRRAGVRPIVDLAALGGGGTLLALGIIAIVGVSAWRRRSAARPVEPGKAPSAVASRPAAATGLRLATAQRGAAATLLGIAAGLAVVVAAVTFTGSLGQLISDPSLVGMSWDVGGSAQFDAVDLEPVRRLVDAEPGIERATALTYHTVTANGVKAALAGFEALKGSPWPPIVAGRLPAAENEALVGRATLDQLGIGIGETVTVTVPVGDDSQLDDATVTQSFTVVGSAVAPAIGLGGTDTPKLGEGILVSNQSLQLPPEMVAYPIVLFDLARGTDPADVIGSLPGGLPTRLGSQTVWFTSAVPAEVSQAGGARRVIWIGVGTLAVAIVGTVIHALLRSVRQRRREYAVLRAIGFTRGQIRTTVLCQSGALVGLALTAAIPVGVGAGRWWWTGFAHDIGIVADPAVPLLLLGGGVLATILLVQAAALVPARAACRTPLATALRSE